MSGRKSRAWLVVVVVVLIGGLVAVFAPRSWWRAEADPPVRLTIRTGPEAEGLKRVAAAYRERTGVRVEIDEVGRDAYLTAMPTQLLSGASSADVVFVPSTMVAEFAAAGSLEPLDGRVAADADLLATYGYAGKTYAIPTDVSSHFLYYRSDLIPTPPDTWDEYLAQARQFTRAHAPGSPTLYGAGMAGKGPEEPPKVFYPLL